MHDYIRKSTKNLSLDELTKFAMLFKDLKKDEYKAYLIWFFTGILGGHRFYLKQYLTGFVIALATILSFGAFGFIGLIDVINIKRLTEKVNQKTVLKIIKEVKRK